ncbi:MAG: LOG family protein [Candidatus Vogelbacteria bacterium]|nr:LOG family protein [Candidatus Vogelbacteria bacterium]
MLDPLHSDSKHGHLKIKIAVSGAAETSFLSNENLKLCEALGREIVLQGAVLVSGATTGVPLWAAKGAKIEGGLSIGMSPATSEEEHVELYKLPLEFMDFIVYTGFGYVGRDILLTRTSDAVLIGPGRIGTLHEFTVAFEDKKPMGILTGDWDTDDIIKEVIVKSHRMDEHKEIVFDSDPKTLVAKVLELVKSRKIDERKHYSPGAFDPNSISDVGHDI